MATEFKFQPAKTYATEENARKAITSFVAKSFAQIEEGKYVRFMIAEHAGRFAPVVINSVGHSAHFAHHGFTAVA